MSEELRHYGAEPFEFDTAHVYTQGGVYKPRGFWVSVLGEQDWPT